MGVTPQALANTVLKEAFLGSFPINKMELQRILYLICDDYLKANGKPLLSENFENGSMLRSVEYAFRSFGGDTITRFAKDAKDNVYVVNFECTDVLRSVYKIWNMYKQGEIA